MLGGLLAAACVVLVALPFLRGSGAGADDLLHEPDARARARLALAEERDRALAALRELEADHRSGALTDADYRASVGGLRQEAARALRALDAETGGQGDPTDRRS